MIWPRLLAVGIIIVFVCSSLSVAYGFPSAGVSSQVYIASRDWYDSWGLTGIMLKVAMDTFLISPMNHLEQTRSLRNSIGEQFKTNYPQKVERAEAILTYVQRWTDYGYDEIIFV